jgi:DNA-3-methyladenine glycosylase I
MATYHDQEWGVPSHDERHLFEMLTLEGAQAGLSWLSVLKRRDGYRRAFADFSAEAVAAFDAAEIERVLREGEVIRNRQKVVSTVENARRVVELRRDGSSLAELLWSFVGGSPVVHEFSDMRELPARTAESEAMSRELRKRGFGFVGPTICYALMQAAGLVNDHVKTCPRWAEVQVRL